MFLHAWDKCEKKQAKKTKSSWEPCVPGGRLERSTAAAFGQQRDLLLCKQIGSHELWIIVRRLRLFMSATIRRNRYHRPSRWPLRASDRVRPSASSHAASRFKFGLEWHRCVSEWQLIQGRYIKVWLLVKWYGPLKISPLSFPQSLCPTSMQAASAAAFRSPGLFSGNFNRWRPWPNRV